MSTKFRTVTKGLQFLKNSSFRLKEEEDRDYNKEKIFKILP